ncbi:MAG: NAD(P)H-quinone oxidoreductase [Chloroflexota bacterium]|nr:NAD(P)H-quinone oxidoreductase [Chloroflexota bacterium]
MRAIVIEQPGGPDVLQMGELPDPTPAPGELLVRVRATALNRLDLMQREGRYPVPPDAPDTLGVEAAGEVVGWGDGVTGWSRGDRVCALLLGGGYAELAAFPAAMAIPIPANLSYEQAAAIPEVFLTAYLNLFDLGGLRSGDYALIHGGASGVGTAAIQLARAAGAHAIVTVGSAEKVERCRALGAAAAINYREGPFEPAVKAASGGRGVDVILDMVGAPYWDQNLACLVVGGRLILVSQQGGGKLEIDLGAIQRKRLRVIGTGLRPLPLAEKVALTERFKGFALDRFADGQLAPVVDRVYPLEDAPDAHRYMASNANVGKIVLRVP